MFAFIFSSTEQRFPCFFLSKMLKLLVWYFYLDNLQVLAEKLPELLDFPKDLKSLEASTKVSIFLCEREIFFHTIGICWVMWMVIVQIQLKYLAEEMQAISKGLEKVVQELTASENDGPVSENFCKVHT